jgi:hypothetical protein
VGSYATLLANILEEREHLTLQWDPHCDPPNAFDCPAVFCVATNHAAFYEEAFMSSLPPGSVVVDPWGLFPDRAGIEVVRVGRMAA